MAFGVCPSDMADQHFATLRESIQLNTSQHFHQIQDDHEKDKTQKAVYITTTENDGEVKLVASSPPSPKTNHHIKDNIPSHDPVVAVSGPSTMLQQATRGTNTAIQAGVLVPTRRAILKVLTSLSTPPNTSSQRTLSMQSFDLPSSLNAHSQRASSTSPSNAPF